MFLLALMPTSRPLLHKAQARINRKAIEDVLDARKDLWAPVTQCLYDLCRKYPDHNRNSVVAAKVLLIGRSHAAAVERGVRNEPGTIRDTTEFYQKRIATPIRRSGLDIQISKLRSLEKISAENAEVVLAAHNRLTDVIASSIGMRKRSFASKYLHSTRLPQCRSTTAWRMPHFEDTCHAARGFQRDGPPMIDLTLSFFLGFSNFVTRYETILDTYYRREKWTVSCGKLHPERPTNRRARIRHEQKRQAIAVASTLLLADCTGAQSALELDSVNAHAVEMIAEASKPGT